MEGILPPDIHVHLKNVLSHCTDYVSTIRQSQNIKVLVSIDLNQQASTVGTRYSQGIRSWKMPWMSRFYILFIFRHCLCLWKSNDRTNQDTHHLLFPLLRKGKHQHGGTRKYTKMGKQGMQVMTRGKGEQKGWTIWGHKQNVPVCDFVKVWGEGRGRRLRDHDLANLSSFCLCVRRLRDVT